MMVAAVTPDNAEYYTPKKILDKIVYPVLGDPIGIDPCGNPYETGDIDALETFRFTDIDGCGLTKPWFDSEDDRKTAFINPPYGRSIEKWIKKTILEFESAINMSNDVSIILLIPVKTDTKWWSNLMTYTSMWYGFGGRIKFDEPIYDDDGAFCGIRESKKNGTFASALILLTNNVFRAGDFEERCDRYSNLFGGIVYSEQRGRKYKIYG